MANDPTAPGEPDDEEQASADAGGLLPDMARRVLALGLSGFFTTEETIRRALGDTVPQEWVDFAASQSERTQREFSEALAREVGRVLEGVDLAELLAQVLEDRSLEVHATIRLQPAGDGAEPRSDDPTDPPAEPGSDPAPKTSREPAGITVSVGTRPRP